MLIDDLCRASWLPERERLLLQQAVVFEITPVVDFTRRSWIDADNAIAFPPNCAPVAPEAWFEWQGRSWGHLWDDALTIGLLLVVGADYGDGRPSDHVRLDSVDAPDGTRWACFSRFATQTAEGRGVCADMVRLFIAPDGTLLHLDLAPITAATGWQQPDDRMIVQYQITVLLALTALCFTHCKGVATTEHAQPRQQRRAAERAGRPPLVTYKTIDIAPVTRILHEEGQIEKTGIKKALHICRGHFAHYTEDAPLFGKYTGTYYRPMHVRGALERGAVVKDYRVLPAPPSRND